MNVYNNKQVQDINKVIIKEKKTSKLNIWYKKHESTRIRTIQL